jgi:hypothetical protein
MAKAFVPKFSNGRTKAFPAGTKFNPSPEKLTFSLSKNAGGASKLFPIS